MIKVDSIVSDKHGQRWKVIRIKNGMTLLETTNLLNKKTLTVKNSVLTRKYIQLS